MSARLSVAAAVSHSAALRVRGTSAVSAAAAMCLFNPRSTGADVQAPHSSLHSDLRTQTCTPSVHVSRDHNLGAWDVHEINNRSMGVLSRWRSAGRGTWACCSAPKGTLFSVVRGAVPTCTVRGPVLRKVEAKS